MTPNPLPRAKMTGWYDPPRLISIAIRVAISTVFGEFADRRETWSATRGIDPNAIDAVFQYLPNEDGEFWFDYVADSGDGWNATYAVARLLAEPELAVAGLDRTLPIGRLLVMGGDQVYPTASREAYRIKLVAPHDEAGRDQPWLDQPPDLYAIPGNHDWYDGLSAFLNLFCRRRRDDTWTVQREGRKIGGRQTQQTRSYFAIQLPQGWWLWGADIQLTGYIDQPQVDFFRHVAEKWMAPDSQIILCTGQPSWTFSDTKFPGSQFRNFSYLERIAELARDRRHRVRVVVSGDTHHYARYTEADRHYVTSGGGGAYLHPTHHLPDRIVNTDHFPLETGGDAEQGCERVFKLAKDAGTGEPAVFPDRAASFWLGWGNLAFAAFNWRYTATMALLLTLFYWLMHAQATYLGHTLLGELLPGPDPSLGETVLAYLALVSASPWGVGFSILFLVGYIYLADFRGWRRRLAGSLHALVQIGGVMLSTCLLARALSGWPGLCLLPLDQGCGLTLSASTALIPLTGLAGGIVAATLLGLYFVVCLTLFRAHWNEAFSALRLESHKNFLRFHIAQDGTLSLYPVGLKQVPETSGLAAGATPPPLSPHLIERPVVVQTDRSVAV